MTVTFPDNDLRGVVHQLRQLATYLEARIPSSQPDADQPEHLQRRYITDRSRSFADAFTSKEPKRKRGV